MPDKGSPQRRTSDKARQAERRQVPPFLSDPCQQFHRSPDPFFVRPQDEAFVQNSTQAVHLFIEYFNRLDPDHPSGPSLREAMDRMRQAYGGGEAYEYRQVEVNFRGTQMRQWIARNYGAASMKLKKYNVFLEVYCDVAGEIQEEEGVRIPLPGIDWTRWPTFLANGMHTYPTLDEETIQLFYERLAQELCHFAGHLIALDGMKTLHDDDAIQKKNKEALDTIVDFGRLASAFRQYRNGNWSLYGPMINEMVRRLGFNIEYPGYLDLIMQAATEESIKTFFPVALANQLPFFSEDGENPVVLKEINEQNQQAAATAIARWKTIRV